MPADREVPGPAAAGRSGGAPRAVRRGMGRRFRRRLGFLLLIGLAFIAMSVASVLLPRSLPMARSRGFDAHELEPNLGWLNTDRPLRFDGDLRGRVVLLDFWTSGCANCQNAIPMLRALEEKYKDEPVVFIGVHSAKFTGEGDRASIRNAVLSAGITHPVVIDADKSIWDAYRVDAWPTFILIGSDGKVIGGIQGEGSGLILDLFIQRGLTHGRQRGDLAEGRPTIDHAAMIAPASGLWFPGKVHAVAPSGGEPGRVFIADTAHHRVLVATWPDAEGRAALIARVGSGERGLVDGAGGEASFNEPRGMAWDATVRALYVADTMNHAVRAIDGRDWSVRTIVGNGSASPDRGGGGAGRDQSLNSPWDVALEPGGSLLVAMAGVHQLWRVEVGSGVARAVAGSGRENSFDASLEDAALAQPSGLAFSADGSRAYFADAESSSVRVADLEQDAVRTIVGYRVESMTRSGLFEFGDVDGAFPVARLQHPLGVTLLRDGRLLVADSYNDALKIVEPSEQTSARWSAVPSDLMLDQPAGIHAAGGRVFVADTNHHRIVMIDEATGEWRELSISGLGDPAGVPEDAIEAVAAVDADGTVTIELDPALPTGAKLNAEFPSSVRVTRLGVDGGAARVVAQRSEARGELPVRVGLEAGAFEAGDRLLVELSLAYCFDDAGVCLPGEAAWIVRTEAGDARAVRLTATIE
ncbi:MAG: thioredoxin-like domain-containing protein [Phycisphaerales bacterium JB037]